VTTDVVGAGSVTRSPDLAAYPQGSQVTLTAVPGAGASFAGWSGALTGGDNPATLTVDAAKTVTATFQPDTTPPVISGVGAASASTSAVVTWTTDEPATSSVSFGPTSAYENGAIGSSTPTRNHSVTLTGLTPGASYHYRVASTNTAGLAASGADGTFTMATSTGPAVDVWYGNNQAVGANGEVQNAYNLLGKVTDPDGVAALSYTLNGGTSRALTIGPTLRRVYNPGDFDADITWGSLEPGANTVVLTARDSLGNITATTVTLQKQSGAAPLPYTVDWSSMARITDRAQVVDGRWRLDGDTVHVQELGYDRLVMVGDVSWQDYEVTVPVTVHSIGPGHNTHLSNAALVGLALNWRGHTARNGDQPVWDWYPTGALAWYRYFDTPKFEMYGNDNSPAVRHQRFRMNFGQTYIFKARSETISNTQVRYSWKVWPQGQAEPATWDLTLVEDNGPMTGSIGVIAHHVDAQFGDISVVPIAP